MPTLPKYPFTPLKNGAYFRKFRSWDKSGMWVPTCVGMIGACLLSSCMTKEPDALLKCVSNGGFSTFSLKMSGDKATKIRGTDVSPGLVKQKTADEIILEFNVHQAPKYCILKINRITGVGIQTCSDGPNDLDVMDNIRGGFNCSKIERKL